MESSSSVQPNEKTGFPAKNYSGETLVKESPSVRNKAKTILRMMQIFVGAFLYFLYSFVELDEDNNTCTSIINAVPEWLFIAALLSLYLFLANLCIRKLHIAIELGFLSACFTLYLMSLATILAKFSKELSFDLVFIHLILGCYVNIFLYLRDIAITCKIVPGSTEPLNENQTNQIV